MDPERLGRINKFTQEQMSLSKYVNSSIINDVKIQYSLSQLIGPYNNFKLLYRGSKDGFSSAIFHSKCDGKGPTLTIIKSKDHGRMFGGFTDIAWGRTGGGKSYMGRSFLFSVRDD